LWALATIAKEAFPTKWWYCDDGKKFHESKGIVWFPFFFWYHCFYSSFLVGEQA
jgi:hypothetical protein